MAKRPAQRPAERPDERAALRALRKAEEAVRVAKEGVRVNKEGVRTANEALRLANEALRLAQEPFRAMRQPAAVSETAAQEIIRKGTHLMAQRPNGPFARAVMILRVRWSASWRNFGETAVLREVDAEDAKNRKAPQAAILRGVLRRALAFVKAEQTLSAAARGQGQKWAQIDK